MKILAIHSTWQRTGSTLNLGFITNVLVKGGDTLYILNRYKEPSSVYLEECGAKLLYFNFPLKMNTTIYLEKSNPSIGKIIKQNFKEPFRFIIGFFLALHYINKLKPDILFLVDSTFPQCLLAGRIKKIKIVGEIQAELIQGKWGLRRKALVSIYNKCDVLLGITNYIISPFQNKTTKHKPKIYIIPNTIESDFEKQSLVLDGFDKPIKDYKIISFFGGSDEKKGINLFLSIVQRMNIIKNNLIFLLIGPFDVQAKYVIMDNDLVAKKRKAVSFYDYYEKNKLSNKLFLLQERDDILNLMNNSDVVLVPYSLPHFARPIIEAFSVKTPVIASDNDFNKEFIQSGENAILNKCDNLDAWIESLLNIIDDEELARTIGNNGFKTYLEHFNPQNISNKIKEAFSFDK